MTTTIILAREVVDAVARALLVALLLVPAFAGCLGDGADEPPLPPGVGDAAASAPRDEATARVLATPSGNVSLWPWVDALGDPLNLPVTDRLVAVAHEVVDGGAFRLLTDGQAFVLVADHDAVQDGEAAVLIARVVDANGATVARGAAAMTPGGVVRTLAMPTFDPLRLDGGYRVEAHWFIPPGDERTAPDAPYALAASGGGLVPRDPFGPLANLSLLAWDATMVATWAAPVPFSPQLDITFDGPTSGTDRPDPLEHTLLGGPATGTYTLSLNGSRVWLASVLLHFADSIVVGTDPATGGNGSVELEFFAEGYLPLDGFVAMPRTQGLQQTFSVAVTVDYETSEEYLPTSSEQAFFAGVDFGPRVGGIAYLTGNVVHDLLVAVSSQPGP